MPTQLNVPNFLNIKQSNPVNTNLSILSNNWSKLRSFLTQLVAYVNGLNIDTESIKNDVLSKIESQKSLMNVNLSSFVNNKQTITSNGVNYEISKNDESTQFTFTKINVSNWNTSALITNIRNSNNVMIYPPVEFLANGFMITFDNYDETNFIVVFI